MSERLVSDRLSDNLTRLRLVRTREILPELVKDCRIRELELSDASGQTPR